jgi:hypothetical protein
MANMSYCRFENTYRDLFDCYHNLNDSVSSNEHNYREKLVKLCQDITDNYDPIIDDDDEDYDDE